MRGGKEENRFEEAMEPPNMFKASSTGTLSTLFMPLSHFIHRRLTSIRMDDSDSAKTAYSRDLQTLPSKPNSRVKSKEFWFSTSPLLHHRAALGITKKKKKKERSHSSKSYPLRVYTYPVEARQKYNPGRAPPHPPIPFFHPLCQDSTPGKTIQQLKMRI